MFAFNIMIICLIFFNLVGKTVDSFVQTDFATETNRTRVVKGTIHPVWNTEIRMPVYVPTMSDRIAVRTMYHAAVGDHEPIATMNFRWSSVITNQFGPAWVNTYAFLACITIFTLLIHFPFLLIFPSPISIIFLRISSQLRCIQTIFP